MGRMRKDSGSKKEHFHGRHRFEHWYRDNTLYFISSKVRGGFSAFAHERAKQIFWDRFEQWSREYGFIPWVASLLDNHYHTLGYLCVGENLGPFMRRFHGSVAKLVNDTLTIRHLPFWRGSGGRDYFDGCLRDETQCRCAYRYTLLQSVRHGICHDWRDYPPHTRVGIELEAGFRRALELKAFLPSVPYQRYDAGRADRHRH